MLLVYEGAVYLTDRKFAFYLVSGYESLVPLFATNGPTLLDGEMVRHADGRSTYFNFMV